MEAQTGEVKAWVGDIDFSTWKYDKVTASRQPGSTFKLFVYTEAMNQGLTPCDKRRDEPISLKAYDPGKKKEVIWRPHNANGYFTWDSLTLKRAFAQSINSVAVRLGQEMGIKRIAETARRMGIKSQLQETPSMALGSSDVNLLEMVNAYSVVADNGIHHKPKLVTKVVDKDGNHCPHADNLVKFTVKGAGSFRAAANGDPTNLDLFHLPVHHAFAGQLTAIVQAATSAGDVELTARAGSLKGALRLKVVK
jgi:membrane peptidoglycan carboxypeptidase